MKQVYRIDDQGFYIEPVIIEGEEQTGLISSPIPEGLYKPKWNGKEWVEGLTQEEIDELTGNTLDQIKQNKINELKQKCEETIETGFTSSNGHFYRTNRDDQINMIGQKDALMSDSTIATVKWKSEDAGYMEISKNEWLSKVYSEAFLHKQAQLFKYDELKKQVVEASLEQVEAIVW
jgi:hypothetical protein